MAADVAVPLHLAVHVLGLSVALALTATSRRSQGAEGWLGFAVGGLLLAASHTITGALLAPEHAWPVYLRAAAYAAIAVGAAGRLVGNVAPVVVAAPMTAHVTAAVAGALAAVASLRGVVGPGRDAVTLGAGLAAWATADLLVRTNTTAAGIVSLVGSMAVGWWVLQRLRTSLLSRFVASFAGVLLVAVVALASAGGVAFVSDLQRDQLAALQERAAARVEQVTVEWQQELLATGGAIAGGTLAAEVAAAATGEVADLDQRARTIAGRLPGIDVVVLLDVVGRTVGSWEVGTRQGPLPFGDESIIAGDPVVAEVLRGATQASGTLAIGDRDLVSLAAVVIAPVVDGQSRLDRRAGVMVVGRRITGQRVVNAVNDLTGADATILIGNSVAVSTLGRGSSAALGEAVATGVTARLIDVAGTPMFVASEPIVGADGLPVGTLALSNSAGVLEDVEGSFVRTLFAASAVGLLLAVSLAIAVSRRTTRPITTLTDAAERVAGGDLDARVDLDRADEVGRLGDAFNDMTGSLSARDQELRRAAAVELELRGRLEVVTDSMDEALVAVDAEGNVTTVNPAAASLLRTHASDLVGRNVREALVGTDPAGTALVEALGEPDARDVRAVRGVIGRGRGATPIAATAAPLRGADGLRLGRVYVLRDVTGEAEVERMKTEFLANISHELRTPLTPIKGYAEVMRSKAVDSDRVVEFAQAITSSAERLERIIAMLVDYASLEAGRTQVRLVPTDVGDEVGAVLSRLRTVHPDRKLVRRIQRGLPATLVDPALLRRVLEELLDNALKFSDGRVMVAAKREDEGRVRITVRDEGVGIDQDQLDVILRDFHQADGSATRHHGGLGLGLSIVQRIVDRFGAELVIESEVDEGTEAHLLVRVAEEGSP